MNFNQIFLSGRYPHLLHKLLQYLKNNPLDLIKFIRADKSKILHHVTEEDTTEDLVFEELCGKFFQKYKKYKN